MLAERLCRRISDRITSRVSAASGGEQTITGYITVSDANPTEGDVVTLTFVDTSIQGSITASDTTPTEGDIVTLEWNEVVNSLQWISGVDGSNLADTDSTTDWTAALDEAPPNIRVTNPDTGKSRVFSPPAITVSPSLEPTWPAAVTRVIDFDAEQEAFANDDVVSTWTNQTGGTNATAASNQPVFKTNANGTKPALYFDGTKGLSFSFTGSGTSWVVSAIIGQPNADALRVWWQNGVNPYFGVQPGYQPTFYDDAAAQESTGILYSNWLPITVVASGTTAKLYVGKTEVARNTGVTARALTCAGLGNLGGFQWLGHMQKIVGANSAPSDSDLSAIIDYMLYHADKTDLRYITCIGDSLTAGLGGATPYPTTLQTNLGTTNYKVNNLGTVGITIVDTSGAGNAAGYILSNYSAYLKHGRRCDGTQSVMILWAGTNDLYYGETGADTATQFLSLCSDAKSAGFKVIAINMIDRGETGSWTVAEQSAFNSAVAAGSASYDVLIDAAAVFNDHTDLDVFQGDGTHLNTTGNGQLEAMVEPHIP